MPYAVAVPVLVVKLIVTPLLIGGAGLAARRWGSRVGGWLIALPLTSGPVAIFLAVDHGASFAARAAEASLAGTIAIVAFCVAFAWAAQRGGWTLALAAGASGFVLVALAILATDWVPWPVTLAAVVLASVAGLRLLPDVGVLGPRGPAPAWDIPMRIVVGTTVVVALTTAAPALGEELSGLLAMVPVIAGVTASFTLRLDGADQAIGVLHGVLVGLTGTAAFQAALVGSLERVSLPAALALALLAMAATHAAVLRLLRFRPVAGRQRLAA